MKGLGDCFFVRPIRSSVTTNSLYYDSSSCEITYTTSSRETKNTIENLEMDTSILYNLSPKTYLYNSCPEEGRQIGYIAEEVYELSKSFATYQGIDGPPVNINWNTITIFLVEEIKKLKQQITLLQNTLL